MILSWQLVRFELKEMFSIAYGDYTHREALIVSINHNGFTGYGECTAIDYYQISLTDFTQKLESVKQIIEKQKIVSPLDFYNCITSLNLSSFLLSALDCAYWDLFGKLENKSFLELNAIIPKTLPESSITISVAPIEVQIKKIADSKWSKFKVKCNQFNEKNIKLLLQLDNTIALDSNGSFTKADCNWLENHKAASLFSYVEQPMKIGADNYRLLNSKSSVNWMADEDCQDSADLQALQSHYSSVNIKLVKCGGLTPALQMITKARKLNYKIMIGCMTESTIGISAGAALASLCDYADLDGANLISNDIATGSEIINGKIQLSEKPGLGISLL